ncbi:hypothetical protein ACHAW6_011026 [Cyclotella cf. meneghiniana]
MDYLVELGVLAPTTEREWASQSFIVPKKDGCVCWISDLCQLKKGIRCKQYPLQIIMDILCKCSGYKSFTKLDINHCIIITPIKKYKYLRLLMGLKCFLDIAQSIMESILAGIDDADVYIDDIGACTLGITMSNYCTIYYVTSMNTA